MAKYEPSPDKRTRVMDAVRDQIADGTLKPGDLAPSGTMLARLTGCNPITSRKALHMLVQDGTLIIPVPGARPRIPHPGQQALPGTGEGHAVPELFPADAEQIARALATDLAARRTSARLSRVQLAALARVRLLSLRHAENARPWQPRTFWARLDTVLGSGGALTSRHDAYRAALGTHEPESS